MGAVSGLLLGLGLFVLLVAPTAPTGRPMGGWAPNRLLRRRLDDADLRQVSVAALFAAIATSALIGAVLAQTVTGVWPVTVAALVSGAVIPTSWVRARGRRRALALIAAWPEAVDQLVSAVRAGLSLSDALSGLAVSGPVPLRAAFSAFAADHRADGNFHRCLQRLRVRLADPVADRVLDALALTRDVGGCDLSGLLRTLAVFLRDDARVRAEIGARQSWTVSAARVALAAPWVVLLLLSRQAGAAHAYNSLTGALVLAVGAAMSAVAYLLMRRLGGLPRERRTRT